MLTKYKDLKPKKGKKNFLKMLSCVRDIQEIFSGRGTQIGHIFKRVFFSGRIILKLIENKEGSRGVRRHAPLENF